MPGNYGSYSPKQKKIAKMSGNKKKMEASDFKKLRMFAKKKKKTATSPRTKTNLETNSR